MYKIVNGRNVGEALANSPFKVGDLVRICSIGVHVDNTKPNSWSVIPEFELLTKKEQDAVKTSIKG